MNNRDIREQVRQHYAAAVSSGFGTSPTAAEPQACCRSKATEDQACCQTNVTEDQACCQSNAAEDQACCQSKATEDQACCQSKATEDQACCQTNAAEDQACCQSNAAEDQACCCGGQGSDQAFGAGFYSSQDLAGLPPEAVAASLGCGNPVAVANLNPGEVVLDLGSGGGIDVLASAGRVGPDGLVYGVDTTDQMLDLARDNLAKTGLTNVKFLKGSIEQVPLPDQSVDVVISNCVINLSTDKPAALAQMFRVLRPGGRIAVFDVVAEDHLTPAQRAERGSYVGCIAGALSRAEYLDGLARAGFTQTSVEYTTPVAPQMHSAMIRAIKPAPEPLRYAAFTSRQGGGNPAGVVLNATGLTSAVQQKIAAKLGYSETAFAIQSASRTFALRYFTPLVEVAFCGHATIATAVALAERHGVGELQFNTPAGPVPVMTALVNGAIQATFTAPPGSSHPACPKALRQTLACLGWSDSDVDPALPAHVANAGINHLVLAARTRQRLASLDYQFEELAALMRQHDWATLQLVWRQDATTFHSRNPAPSVGVAEDPATGSAAAALGAYLRQLGEVTTERTYTIIQGEDLGRPSELLVRVFPDQDRAQVSGFAAPMTNDQ